MQTLWTRSAVALTATLLATLSLAATSASAQTQLLSTEFNEDDQAGFDLWPATFQGVSSSIAIFPTDPGSTSGTTTVTVTSSTGFGTPVNRGSTDGSPPGYSYQHLYEDLLHAISPTGVLTLDFSGLNPDESYKFTLYAWDPGATSATDKEWTVTGGTGVPTIASVNFQDTLLDNGTFTMVFDITTDASGSFQLENTSGLDQSAINGFKLDSSTSGSNYCPLTPNSAGLGAVMSTSGTASVTANNLGFLSGPMAAGEPGIFYYGPDQLQLSFGNGNRCVGGGPGTIVRMFPFAFADASGFMSTTLDNAGPAHGQVVPGATLNFQAWFRDPLGGGAGFNLSDALSILFTP